MLPKKNRANKKDIEKLFKNKGFLSSHTLTFRYSLLSRPGLDSRISFIVPKKVTKSAFLRNKLRRIGYLALEKQIKILSFPIIGVFTFIKIIKNEAEKDITNEIKQIFSKINSKSN